MLSTFVNLQYIQKLEILYQFDVRLIFTPMYGGQICHVLLTVQKHASAASLIDRQQTLLAFLHKQN